MSRNASDAASRGAGAGRTPDRRTKVASAGGLVGGFGLSLLALSRTGVGVDPGSVGLAYPLGFALFAGAVLAVNARFEGQYGRRGRGVALLFALSMATYAVSTVAVVVALRVVGAPVGPFAGLVGAGFLGTRLFASLYGVVLWRRTDANRVAAGLFALVLPSLFVFGPLALFGLPAFGVELPLYAAFVAFGYDLWTGGQRAATSE